MNGPWEWVIHHGADTGGLISNSPVCILSQTPSYSLRLRATDSGQPPLHEDTEVAVEVVDVNDNPPRFFQLNYSTSVQVRTP